MDSEVERIKEAYRLMELKAENELGFYSYRDHSQILRLNDRYWHTLDLLSRYGYQAFDNMRILDIGCGNGVMLRQFIQWGATPDNLSGIELRREEVDRAFIKSPNLDIRWGNAADLPWNNEHFDLVCLHTVFSSILDSQMRAALAREADRVLRLKGAVLWYDFMINNPSNPHVRGVRLQTIRLLFPDYALHARRITLAPPIARRIPVLFQPLFYPMLSAIPFFRTHYLALLIKSS